MWIKKRMNKYGNRSSVYNGYYYQSMKEADYARLLDQMKKARDLKDKVARWTRQETISLDVNGFHIANYRIDFHVWYADGHEALIEVKGFETDVWRMKWRLLEAIYSKEHPDIELVVIK